MSDPDDIERIIEKAKREERERIKTIALRAISDEPELPSDMPDEAWEMLKDNRDNVEEALRSAVRLTKSGITDRFEQALKGEK